MMDLWVIAQADAAADQGKSLLEHVRSGGTIGYVIIGLSVVALALAIIHLIQIRSSRLAPPRIVSGLDGLLAAGDTAGATAYCGQRDHACFLTRVFGAALRRCSRSPFGFLELRAALEEAGQAEVARLNRAVDGIALIASIAPMLGLLGTVVGMVGAFETISSTEGYARPAELAGYIAVALITTVLGLIVAIPCTTAASFFRNRIDTAAGEVAEVIEEISGHLEAKSRAAADPAPRPARPAAGGPATPAPQPPAAPGVRTETPARPDQPPARPEAPQPARAR